MRCFLLTTAFWIVSGGVLLVAVGLIADRIFGRPKWTLDSYHRDGAVPQERI